jgi:hypothetical protein
MSWQDSRTGAWGTAPGGYIQRPGGIHHQSAWAYPSQRTASAAQRAPWGRAPWIIYPPTNNGDRFNNIDPSRYDHLGPLGNRSGAGSWRDR